MLPVILIGFFLIATRGVPANGSPVTKTYTLPDGTIVNEYTYTESAAAPAPVPIRRSSTQTITLSTPQVQEITTEISGMPGTTINQVPGGSDTVSIPGDQLITLLKNQGIELPPGTITANVDNPNGVITINLNGLLYVIDKKSEVNRMHPSVKSLVNILKQDPTVPQNNNNPTIDRTQFRTIINTLPGATIQNQPGSPEAILLPASSLQILLRQMGVPVTDDITKVPGIGPDPNKIIVIYVDQVHKIIDNWSTYRNVSPIRIIRILRRIPGSVGPGVRGPGGNGPVVKGQGSPGNGNNGDSSLINGGRSYLANTGVNRKKDCNRGLIDNTATQLKDGINTGLNGIASTVTGVAGTGGGVLGPVGGAATAVVDGAAQLLSNAVSGVDFAVQDAACGLGNMAKEAATALDTGNIVKGVGEMGQEFVGGVGNMAEDLISGAASGLGDAAHDIFGYLTKF